MRRTQQIFFFCNRTISIMIVICASLFICCNGHKKKIENAIFETLDEKRTGLDFVNKLTPTSEFNMFNYMYFYNGAGIGAGDFNNDGLIDLFFASNQGRNSVYLNKGKLSFKNV